MMHTKPFFISGLGLALALTVARAQIPNASQQVDSVQQRRQLESTVRFLGGNEAVAELYEGEIQDVGPQSVLLFKPHRTFLEASADAQYFYSDNIFLANRHKLGTDVLVSTVQAALAPTAYEFAGGLLSPRVGYQHQWFNYDLIGSGTVHVYPSLKYVGLDTFDFNVSTVFGDVAWRWQNWNFALGFDYRRLLDSGSYNEFYSECVPRWSVSREFTLNDSLAFSIGYEGDYRFTTAVPPAAAILTAPVFPNGYSDRTDHGLVLVGSWRLCRYAILQPFYRFQITHYTRIKRDDVLNSFGVALYCPITKQISLRTFLGYDISTTDGVYEQNYQKLDAGVGANLTVRF